MPRIPGLRPLIRLPDDERDVRRAVDDELSFHLDMLVDELVAAGHAPDAARREAERRFGDVERVRARCYETSTARETHMRRTDWFTAFGQDVVYALRGARRAPGFSLVVLLTLALGIGATTAMFSVVRGVLLRPLPFPEAERVVRLWPENPAAAVDHGQLSQTELRDWERDLRGFAAVAGFQALGNGLVYGDGAGEPIYAKTAFVSAGFFAALGTPPALGRALAPGEHVAGANRAVVVSHGFWQRQLGADPSVIGRSIRLRDAGPAEAYTVVGVMPRDFAFPSPEVAVWMPESVMGPDDVGGGREARWLDVVARLRPGVTPEQGRAELQGVLRGYAARYPDTNGGWTTAAVQDVRDSIVGPVRRGLLVLLGAVGLVLLVVCANVANLVLVRATTRARELALRTAIGAGRWRLLRLLLTESLLLALVGGALGVLTAWWGVRTLVALSGDFLPRAADVRLDAGVLAFAVGVSVVTGVVFGLWPALRASNAGELAPALRENGRGSAGSGATHRARAALVTAEVALAVILVVGSGLMLRSFQRLTSADPGFRPEHALLVRLDVDAAGGSGALAERRQRIVERVRAVPGVLAAGASKNAPFTGQAGEPVPFTVPGQPAPAPGEEPRVLLQPASPGYLRALGVPLLAGQDISTTAGDSTASPTAVISQGMAERFWRGRSPVGESFVFRNIPFRIIGVAGDVRSTRLDSLSGFTAYVPDAFMARVGMSLVVRTAGDPMALSGPLRAAIREVVPGQAFVEMVPLGDKLAAAASTARFFTVLVTVFGVLALALAAIGLYGVVSYVVRLREREIGVRMALGAPPRRVLALVLRQGMTPVAVGLAIGLAGAFTATRVLRALLYEVSATDPLIFLGVAALLGAVAMVASYVPSRRASRVQPAITLRAE
jgi:predicted permease